VRSKSACLQQQTASLKNVSKDFASSVSNQKAIAEKRVGAKLQNLKLLMDSGVLSHEELSKHARVVAGIDSNLKPLTIFK
jgi:argininosuccinate lyase